MQQLTDQDKSVLDHFMQRIDKISEDQHQAAIDTSKKLANDKPVSDGELLDAMFELISRLKFPDPLIGIGSEMIKRFMDYGGIQKTPDGIKRAWFDEEPE